MNIEALKKQAHSILAEVRQYEDAQAEIESAKWVGKYFKYRNSYSCPEKPSDYWWTYFYAYSCEGARVQMRRFQIDKDGNVSIDFESGAYNHSGGYIEITKAEYEKAHKKMMKKLERLVNK